MLVVMGLISVIVMTTAAGYKNRKRVVRRVSKWRVIRSEYNPFHVRQDRRFS